MLMVSIVNDNKGLGKYGDNHKGIDQYRKQLERAVDIIAETGPKRVLVQPVGETRTDTGRWFEKYCIDKLTGFQLVYNGGSRPANTPAGYHAFAYHPATVSADIPKDALVVTDHSQLLIELQGGDLYGYSSPNVLKKYAEQSISAGNSFIYYGFAHKKIDKGALEVLGSIDLQYLP
jgi:hypothetical protein